MNESNTRLRATITGVVQGIGFRGFVLGNARSLGLTGWARNWSDGSVEVSGGGPRVSLERPVTLIRHRPQQAVIGSFELNWLGLTDEYRASSSAASDGFARDEKRTEPGLLEAERPNAPGAAP